MREVKLLSASQALPQCRELVAAARAEAKALRGEAQAQIAALREEAKQAGFAQGRKEALELFNKKQESIAPELLKLVFTVAEEVLGEAMSLQKNSVLKRIERAINCVKDEWQLRIIANPADAELLETSLPHRIESDTRLAPGYARLCSPAGTIEINPQKHLSDLKEQFIGNEAS